MPAALPMLAEPARIPRALIRLVLGAHMKENALLIPALPELRKVPALRHAVMVEPVKEVAAVAFFAESAQPVLANHAVAARIWSHVRGCNVDHTLEPQQRVHIDINVVHAAQKKEASGDWNRWVRYDTARAVNGRLHRGAAPPTLPHLLPFLFLHI